MRNIPKANHRRQALLLTALLVLMSACGQPETTSDSADDQTSTGTPSESADVQRPTETSPESTNVQQPTGTPSESAAIQPSTEEPPESSDVQSSEADASQKNDTPENKEVAVSELFSEDGHAADSDGTEYDYSYHVPQIEDDTPDAAGINDEIKAMYGDLAGLCMESVNNKEAPNYCSVTYENYRSGTVLSLLIKTISYYGYEEKYAVYNYDTEKGAQLANGDILAMQGITEAEYLQAVRRAAAAQYDKIHFTVDEVSDWDYTNFLGELNERRSWTLSSQNIVPDLPAYLDNDGKLHAVVPIYSLVTDYSLLDCPLLLDTQKSASALSAEYPDFLSAAFKDNKLTITFTHTDQAQDQLSDYEVEVDLPYDEEIPVHGCYSDYTDMFFFTVSGSPWPRLFLLTGDGRVEYVDIGECIPVGYYCVSGPLPNLKKVSSLTQGPDEYGEDTVYAGCKNGDRIDLSERMSAEYYSMSARFKADWTASVTHLTDGDGSYEEYYSLVLTDCDNVNMTTNVFDAGLSTIYNGSFYYLGMADDGAVYSYRLLNDETSELSHGAVALCNTLITNEHGAEMNSLLLKELSGDHLIYTKQGETTTFVETFG